MKFKYTGYNSTAQKVSGVVEAENANAATAALREQRIRPTQLVMEGSGGAKTKSAVKSGGGTKSEFSLGQLFGLGVASKPDLVSFTAFIRQLATLQGSGIPIVQALVMLAEQTENRGFAKTLMDVQQQIQEGTSLAQALRKHERVFDRLFINLIAAGEVSGSLDKVLLRLATYYEKAAALKRKVISACTYPTVILVLVVVVLLILLGFVVPTFANMFQSNGQELPAATKFVLDLSNGVRKYWYVIALVIISIVGSVIAIFKNPEFKRQLDPYFLKLPLFGDLFKKIAVARFSRTLSTMIQSGVPIIDALDITSRVSGNSVIEEAITKIRQSISEGNSIADPLARTGVFPKMVVGMIAIGEQTGSIEHMLSKIAEFYEDEVDNKVAAMTSILEPLMIVVVGIVVAGVLIPMYLPIFKMGDVIGGG